MAKKAKAKPRNKAGNPRINEINKATRWVKGDPRAVEAGKLRQKKLPKLQELMDALLGGDGDIPITETPIAKIVKALIKETENTKLGAQRVAAAKEVLDRAFGKVRDKENGGDEEAKRLPITGFNIKRK